MSPDQVVFTGLAIVVVLWWLDCAPLYILAGKAGIESPGWAFMPMIQFDVMGRVATAYAIPDGPQTGARTVPWRRNLWSEIAHSVGANGNVGQMCLLPGPHLVAQWMIAIRA